MKSPYYHLFQEDELMDRFERQTKLNDFGAAAQQKLIDSKVLVVGSGGLGCPALQYLAAAGVGTLGIADGDNVMPSNLNRQVIFGEGDVGNNKALVAAKCIRDKYKDTLLNVYPFTLINTNTLNVIDRYDLIIDATDNFQTRYMLNDACVLLNKPLVYGAIYQYEGQVAVFNLATRDGRSTNYRNLFPQPPEINEVPDCNTTGVLGVLPGMIGVMMASEAIKVLTNYTTPLINKMLLFSLKNNSFYEMDIPSITENTDGAENIEEFLATDYSLLCGGELTITWDAALEIINRDLKNNLLLDVRTFDEQPRLYKLPTINIPLQELEASFQQMADADTIIVFCQSGSRSLAAAKKLSNVFPGKKVVSITGGISELKEEYLK